MEYFNGRMAIYVEMDPYPPSAAFGIAAGCRCAGGIAFSYPARTPTSNRTHTPTPTRTPMDPTMIVHRIVCLSAVLFVFACDPVWAADTSGDDTLCPTMDEVKNKTPGTLADIQDDIDRLTLCIERARLLEQLDGIGTAREKMLTESLEKAAGPGGLSIPIDQIPALTAGQLPGVPGIDIKNLKPGDIQVDGAAADPFASVAAEAVKKEAEWQVRKIWGQGGTMRAQLTQGDGVLVNVTSGDPLPDGTKIDTLSVKGVTVSRNGKVSELTWEQIAEGADVRTTP
jgi:hypothetical protein